MRIVVAGALLAFSFGVSGCSQDPGKTVTNSTALETDERDRSVTATQLLETTQWPKGFDLVPLSPTALRQLQNSILGDSEMARSVSDVAAAGLMREAKALGALLLIGVTDPVVGNMSFVDGLREAAFDEPSSSRWGPLAGWISSSNEDILAMLPIGSVIVFATTESRTDLDQILIPLVERFIDYSAN
ncbi:MAG: hypothetical protein QF637_03455 [Acidimicrobiales bacterium]|nr:hypothetical protein [Acidimicrobiales bacterium]